jgi:predicted DNA-binding transcriptional regulator YafY
MVRTERLFALIQTLRRRRQPVSGIELAAKLRISPITLHRDVATPIAQGVPIEGEADAGYVLRSGFLLLPLMLAEKEADAIILGLLLVAKRVDADLAQAADDVLTKIVAMLPPVSEEPSDTGGPLPGVVRTRAADQMVLICATIRTERKLLLRSIDRDGIATERTVWPVALGFFGASDVLAAWCERRSDFRHFRLDRIKSVSALTERLPKRRQLLLAEWRLQENVDGPY